MLGEHAHERACGGAALLLYEHRKAQQPFFVLIFFVGGGCVLSSKEWERAPRGGVVVISSTHNTKHTHAHNKQTHRMPTSIALSCASYKKVAGRSPRTVGSAGCCHTATQLCCVSTSSARRSCSSGSGDNATSSRKVRGPLVSSVRATLFGFFCVCLCSVRRRRERVRRRQRVSSTERACRHVSAYKRL